MQETDKGKTVIGYAMEYGFFLGIYFIVAFLVMTQTLRIPALSLIFDIMFISVPFVLYYLMKKYQKREPLAVRFIYLWSFGIFLFFFASLLCGLVQYIYCRFIDPYYIENMFASTLNILETSFQGKDATEFVQAMKDGLKNGAAPTAIEMVYQSILMMVFFGSLLSIVVALFAVPRRKKLNIQK